MVVISKARYHSRYCFRSKVNKSGSAAARMTCFRKWLTARQGPTGFNQDTFSVLVLDVAES